MVKVPCLHGKVNHLIGVGFESNGKALLVLLQVDVQGTRTGRVANL